MPTTPLPGVTPQSIMQHQQHNQQSTTMMQQNSPLQQQQPSPMQTSMQSPVPNTPPAQLSGMIPQSPAGQMMSPNHPVMSPNSMQQQQQQQQMFQQQQMQQQQQQQVAMQQRQQVLLRQQQLQQQRQQSQQQMMTQQQDLPNPPMPPQQTRPPGMIVGGGQMPMIQRAMGPNGVVASTTMPHPVPFSQQSSTVLSGNVQSIQTQQQSFPPAGNQQFQPGFNTGPRPNQTHVNMPGAGPTSIQQLQSTAAFSTTSPAGVQQRPQVPQQIGSSAAWTPGQVSTTVVQQGQVNQPAATSTPSNIPVSNI